MKTLQREKKINDNINLQYFIDYNNINTEKKKLKMSLCTLYSQNLKELYYYISTN